MSVCARPGCGEFEPSYPGQRYCSPRCRGSLGGAPTHRIRCACGKAIARTKKNPDATECWLCRERRIPGPKTKRCVKCRRRLSISNYNHHPSTRDGYDARCKPCIAAWKRTGRWPAQALQRTPAAKAPKKRPCEWCSKWSTGRFCSADCERRHGTSIAQVPDRPREGMLIAPQGKPDCPKCAGPAIPGSDPFTGRSTIECKVCGPQFAVLHVSPALRLHDQAARRAGAMLEFIAMSQSPVQPRKFPAMQGDSYRQQSHKKGLAA